MLRTRRLEGQEGFTLIELMIVVAIIGILAAIAIPKMMRFQLRSRAGEGKVNLAALRTAQEAYMAEFNRYVSFVSTPQPSGVIGVATVPTRTGHRASGPFQRARTWIGFEICTTARSIGTIDSSASSWTG